MEWSAAWRSRTAAAWSLFFAALALVFGLITVIETLGHPDRGRLIPGFRVSAPDTKLLAVNSTLFDEAYRYSLPNDVRRVTFTSDIAPQLNGLHQPVLLISDAYAFVSVTLNGVPLSDQGGRDGPIPDRQFEPRLYYLTPALRGGQTQQAQILSIDITGAGGRPYLREVFAAEIQAGIFAYRTRRFVAVEGVVAATAIAIFAGLLSLAITPLVEHRALSGLFAGMMLLWAVRNFTFAGPVSDVPWPVLQGFYFASTFLILFVTVLLINLWTVNSRFIRRYFAVGLVVLLALLYLPVLAGMPDVIRWSRQIGNAVGVACFAMMIGQLIRALIVSERPPWLEMFLFMACLCTGLFEIAGDGYPEMTRWLWPQTGQSMAYGPLMPLPLAAGMLVNFVRRTVDLRETLRADNAGLQNTVAAREAEIARVYAEREAEVRRSALMDERQRIMRDMHDGIGSQLLGLMFQVRQKNLSQEQLAAGLQESLDDLNLVVESLDQTEHGLAEALGAFRARIAPKCEAAGVRLDWDVDRAPTDSTLSPAKVLHVYRILQEACINALRHGQPHWIKIACGNDDGLWIAVEDDGLGFDPAVGRGGGRGLANMRRRAAAVGGTLVIDSAPGRTRLTVRIPAGATAS